MLNVEIAEVLKDSGKMFDIAQKTHYNLNLNNEETEIAKLTDAWVREIADKGDSDKELAAFIRRTVNEEVYNAPDELLDRLFDRGSVGEFDDYEIAKNPKNTLVAHEAAKGGTVDASYIDWSMLAPTWKNRQVEFEIPYIEMRRGGFKTVATYTTYAKEALQNALFADLFGVVDAAITGGDQKISETATSPTQTSMDKLSLYLIDRNPDAVAVTLSKYCQAIGRMTGYSAYMSEEMKNNFNRYGLVKFFDGISLAGISSAKKMADGSKLIPDKRIFGIAGKIGRLDMKGDIHVYEDMDNANEVCRVRVKDFTYGYAITNIENAAKIELA